MQSIRKATSTTLHRILIAAALLLYEVTATAAPVDNVPIDLTADFPNSLAAHVVPINDIARWVDEKRCDSNCGMINERAASPLQQRTGAGSNRGGQSDNHPSPGHGPSQNGSHDAPEPSSIALVAMGLFTLWAIGCRRRRNGRAAQNERLR